MQIYKIFRGPEWADFQAKGKTLGAPIDTSDGFIHFSTASQAGETAAKYFAHMDGLMLIAFNADSMGPALKWEPSRGGDLFPHLYRPLELSKVLWAKPLPYIEGAHVFPKEMI